MRPAECNRSEIHQLRIAAHTPTEPRGHYGFKRPRRGFSRGLVDGRPGRDRHFLQSDARTVRETLPRRARRKLDGSETHTGRPPSIVFSNGCLSIWGCVHLGPRITQTSALKYLEPEVSECGKRVGLRGTAGSGVFTECRLGLTRKTSSTDPQQPSRRSGCSRRNRVACRHQPGRRQPIESGRSRNADQCNSKLLTFEDLPSRSTIDDD